MSELRLETTLPPALVDALAERVAEIVLERLEAPTASPWLSIDQAAEHTGIPKQTLYKLTASKAIRHTKPGNRILFRREDLDAWLDGHREGPSR